MGEENQLKKIKQLKGRMENNLSGFLRMMLVGLLVLLQVGILGMLPFIMHGYTVYFYFIMELFSLIFILIVTNQNRSSSYKIAWFCIVLICPVSGVIMFALWGRTGKRNKLQKQILERIKEGNQYLSQDKEVLEVFCKEHPVSSRMSKYMVAEKSPLYKNNQVKYYRMGEDAFEDIFKDIEKAERFVLIDFFIVAEGAIWDQMHAILKERIKDGVQVKFMYDDFGAMIRTGKNFAKNLIAEGFEVEIFNPIHKYTDKLFMNYRSHQKIIVVDGNIAYTGGFNIADEYANLVDRFGVWKDTGVRVVGDAVWGMTVTFLQMWHVCSDKAIDYDFYRPSEKFPESQTYCHVLSDGPATNPDNFIETMYKQMINYSGDKLYIMTPYMVLEDYMVKSLIEAVDRGVDVRIITPYIPDKKHVKWLTEYNYGALLKHGIRIYEYLPGFIHAKVIMNEHCGIVGTINMDYRSFYLHYENGVWIYDQKWIEDVTSDFEDCFAISKEVSYEEWLKRPMRLRVYQYILNVFATLI